MGDPYWKITGVICRNSPQSQPNGSRVIADVAFTVVDLFEFRGAVLVVDREGEVFVRPSFPDKPAIHFYPNVRRELGAAAYSAYLLMGGDPIEGVRRAD